MIRAFGAQAARPGLAWKLVNSPLAAIGVITTTRFARLLFTFRSPILNHAFTKHAAPSPLFSNAAMYPLLTDGPASIPVDALVAHVEAMVALAGDLQGHLSDADVRWLALAGATFDPRLGAVLEIGSYLGESTVVLAHSVQFAGGRWIVAVDPLTPDAESDPYDKDPATLPARLDAILRREGVAGAVEFHR